MRRGSKPVSGAGATPVAIGGMDDRTFPPGSVFGIPMRR
jgi:hypothetical protein